MPKTRNPNGEAPARRLFVFDSLLPGEMRHERIAGCECLGEARTEAVFDLIDMGLDAVLVQGGRTSVRGLLYVVDAATLKRLDDLYSHPRYCRRVTLSLADGRRALAYLFPRSHLSYHSRIPGGSWPAHRIVRQVPMKVSSAATAASAAAVDESAAAPATAGERLRAAEAEAAETDRLADEAYQRWDEAVAANIAAAHRLEQARKEVARLQSGAAS